MRIVAASDIHGELIEIPKCDLFILAGDLCPTRDASVFFQANWLKDHFNKWMDQIVAKHTVFIAGNHDWIFQSHRYLLPELGGIYLNNSPIEIEGIKIYGSPWTPFFNHWAFNFPRGDTQAARACWDLIPDGTDILVTHGPPYGYGDLTTHDRRVIHAGCPELLMAVRRVKPKWHFFGHFHGGCVDDTIMKMAHDDGSVTYCCNVSVLNDDYIHTKPTTMIEY